MADSRSDSADLEALREAGKKRAEVLGALYERHRPRLLKMVRLRMDPKLRTRIDPTDVLQEAFLEISERVDDYLEDPKMPLFVWMRFITAQRLIMLYRHHVDVKKRDVRRQVPIDRPAFPQASSAVMARQLVGMLTSPSGRVMQAEAQQQIEGALEQMNPKDREVLVLRHFEQLSNLETAKELEIEESAASKRYLRALQRLREILDHAGGDGDDA